MKRKKDGKQWNGPSRKVLQRQLCGSDPLAALLPTWAERRGRRGRRERDTVLLPWAGLPGVTWLSS